MVQSGCGCKEQRRGAVGFWGESVLFRASTRVGAKRSLPEKPTQMAGAGGSAKLIRVMEAVVFPSPRQSPPRTQQKAGPRDDDAASFTKPAPAARESIARRPHRPSPREAPQGQSGAEAGDPNDASDCKIWNQSH